MEVSTKAYQNFNYGLDQVEMLAVIVGDAGARAVNQLQSVIKSHVTRVTGLDWETVNNMSDEERDAISGQVPASDVAEMNRLANLAGSLAELGSATTPQMLFTFLLTKFEAYLVDVVIAIAKLKPDLLGMSSILSDEDISIEVDRLFYRRSLRVVGEEVFEKKLGIPFSKLYALANTSSEEVDEAKAVRNIHIHNKGIVNNQNKNRIRGKEVNDEFQITVDYAMDIKNKISSLVAEIDKAIITTYPDLLSG